MSAALLVRLGAGGNALLVVPTLAFIVLVAAADVPVADAATAVVRGGATRRISKDSHGTEGEDESGDDGLHGFGRCGDRWLRMRQWSVSGRLRWLRWLGRHEEVEGGRSDRRLLYAIAEMEQRVGSQSRMCILWEEESPRGSQIAVHAVTEQQQWHRHECGF